MELHGKPSLMGVYEESLKFVVPPTERGRWPKIKRVGIFALIEFEDKDEHVTSFSMKIDYNGSIHEIIHQDLPPNPERGPVKKKLNLIMVNERFPFEGPGEIKFIFEFYKNNKLIKSLSPRFVWEISEEVTKD
jgi:hypothetical protein